MMLFMPIIYFILTCITSFYFFPFAFSFMPTVNTKMMLAVIGLVICIVRMVRSRSGDISRYFFFLSLLALLVSFVSLASAFINNTNDFTYATYIMSMWVWLGGAYAVVSLIRFVHKSLDIVLISNYLIAACVLQCILALAIDNSPAFSAFVNRMVADLGFIEMDRLSESGRLYGIGCSLDVAGSRFAAVLLILSFVCCSVSKRPSRRYLWVYYIAFGFICVIGNMIGRTTTVGAAIALFVFLIWGFWGAEDRRSWYGQMAVVFFFVVSVASILYSTNFHFRSNLRFAFEGFFSLVENGYWETNSNTILQNMVVFPKTIHTWIIGDGYMLNPYWVDGNYVGPNYGGGFYMGTDIGYLRFIFYFGVIGLISFICFFVSVVVVLAKRCKGFRWMFCLLLALNLIIWVKVSTDLFPVFAVYLSACLCDGAMDEFHVNQAI